MEYLMVIYGSDLYLNETKVTNTSSRRKTAEGSHKTRSRKESEQRAVGVAVRKTSWRHLFLWLSLQKPVFSVRHNDVLFGYCRSWWSHQEETLLFLRKHTLEGEWLPFFRAFLSPVFRDQTCLFPKPLCHTYATQCSGWTPLDCGTLQP